jgi:hypothetical protein
MLASRTGVVNDKRRQDLELRADFPTEEEISARACEMFFLERRTVGMAADYWRLAEDDLLDRAARKLLKRR